jgi:two-component system phosphate regulon sensor histidine kinase PhoR
MKDSTVSAIHAKPRALVVDDEKRIRDGCRKTLALEGFEVATAESGYFGMRMIEKEHFDIILLDLMMPGPSGMDVLAYVKNYHPDTVIIVITGYATMEHAIEAMKRGAFDFISKPFSPQDLRKVASKAMEYIRTLQDITTEKSRMRALINQLSGGVMATDSQKKVALANTAFLKMMNYRGDCVGRPAHEIISHEELNQMIEKALSMPEQEFAELTEELHVAGKAENEEAILSVRCVPFRDRLGRNLGTITVLYDITALKKMDQIKSDFVSMVAHEIRSPINSVLAQLKVVLDGLAGEVTPKQHEILGRASDKIQALVDFSSDLLDLARIESGLLTQEKEKLKMSDLLADQVAFHQASARAKHILLELNPHPTFPLVLGNRYHMEEVLSNLITNAITYTPKGGQVAVSASIENEFLCIRVSDSGVGIPKEELGRIFDRFYRVKNKKTRFIVGTGLGLAIVKSIVEAHNGMVCVDSEPDKGSIFSIYVPLIKT